MNWMKKNSKLILSILVVTIFVISIGFNTRGIEIQNNLNEENELGNVLISAEDNFDILDFWQSEIGRVNATDLNIEFMDNETIEYTNPYTKKDYEFTKQEIYFDSPNWVGEKEPVIRLHGYLLYPEHIESSNPGCLCMHGLGGDANQALESLGYLYLEEGFIVLCHDHPGHGDSEGAKPSPENFFLEGTYNESAHYYLTLCGAIQGLRVLENLTRVDKTKIMVTGGSYGALNTMWLSSICGERIAGAVPYIAVGDLKKTLEDDTKLLFWVWDKSPDEIPDDYWEKQGKYFDAKYYLKSSKLPPIFWQIGTNDEFFHYHSINGTLEAVEHDDAYVQIYPNGHHGFPGFENTTKFFIDYVLKNGSRPPKMDVSKPNIRSNLFGDNVKVEVEVDSEEEVESVQVCFKYADVVGASWQLMDLRESENDAWKGTISPGLISSQVDYYIVVNLKGKESIWFSSKIYTAGLITSNFSAFFYIIVIGFITIPALVLGRRRYIKNVKNVNEKLRKQAKKYLLVELALLAIVESLFYLALILPWIIFEGGGVVWNFIYFFNNFYTWTDLWAGINPSMVPIVPFMAAAFLIGWIIYSQIALMKPMFSGFLKVGFPIFVFVIIWVLVGSILGASDTSSLFGGVIVGIGPYMMLFSVLALFPIGIWKRKYQTKLGIHQPKRKWYNIDRWFRIKSQERLTERSIEKN